MFFIKTAQSVEAWGRTRAAENRAASELFPVRVPYSSQRSLKVARAVVDKVFIRRMRSIRWMVDMRAGGKDDRRPQADDPSDFNFQVEHSHHLTQASFDHRYHHAVLLQTPTVFIEQPRVGIAAQIDTQTGRSVVQQACTLPVFGGTCTPLNGTACTNTPGLQSLMLNPDADCAAFTLPDCQFTPDQPALEEFSDTSEHLEGLGIQSVQCFENAGTVNGFTQGSPEDIAQEQADEDAADGIVLTPPANCTEGPIDISADQQREDDADGIVVSGPITCSFD
ncbi:hypothetical protein FB451DRAFT_1453167 [Mycena latifolia]|nr:hypothetical protein FB451DRAFT_1453167 [Mycena latifolia]